MFIETWRKHWGLSQDPFACEDADKDLILTRMDSSAVHSGFDRLFGDPESPAPGIIFGEKGSGKSGGNEFELFTEGEWAWPASPQDDAKIITAMKRGATAVLTARSARGTITKDTFSLLGFTAAVEDAEKRCSG